jgi:hypothetical protein
LPASGLEGAALAPVEAFFFTNTPFSAFFLAAGAGAAGFDGLVEATGAGGEEASTGFVTALSRAATALEMEGVIKERRW